MRNVFTLPMRNMILLIVAVKGRAHGYEIVKEIEKITSGVWKPSYSNLYPLLRKLTKEGLLEPQEGYHGMRKVVKYSLTDKGWMNLERANLVALRGLLTAAKYHMLLREKLDTMDFIHEPSSEALKGYLLFLDEILGIFIKHRDALRKRLEGE